MGFITLGAILEQIYGKTLDVLFAEKLAGPLKLTRSRFCVSIGEENTVVSYRRDGARGIWCGRRKCLLYAGRVRAMPGHSGAFPIWKSWQMPYMKSGCTPAGLAEMAERSYTDGFPQKRGLGYLIIDEDDP